jgi:hypothetical protein
MALPLAIHTSEWPYCATATALIAEKRGSAYRISSRRILAAIANGRGMLYDQMRSQIRLFRDRGVDVVDLYAVEEERRPENPWRINGRPVHRSAELLELAAEQVRTSFDIPVETRILPVSRGPAEAALDTVFGCSDMRYFDDVAAFVKTRFGDKVNQYYWAGSATSYAVPIDTVDFVHQLKAAKSRNIHILFHDDCVGHGGRHKLGDMTHQLSYYRRMIAEESPLRRAAHRDLPEQRFHFFFLEKGKEVMELGTWLPRIGA